MLTWIEIDVHAFNNNISILRRRVGDTAMLMPVVKSQAYGHGLEHIARLCDRNREVDRVCVASSEEASTLLVLGFQKPIVILSFFAHEPHAVERLIASDQVTFPVYRLDHVDFLQECARRAGHPARIHLKIDIGTSRVGIRPEEARAFLKKIARLPLIRVEGLFGHFSSSEESARITREQQAIFDDVVRNLREHGFSPEILHTACSASTLLHTFTHGNAVRPGIACYGIYPCAAAKKKVPGLRVVLTWKTRIIQVKTVEKGTAIGYGQTYIMPKRGVIATLPIGYFDGFDRSLSNNADVLIRGVRCRVRGRVCMNLTMVEIPLRITRSVRHGDEVIVLGKQGNQSISAEELAKKSSTIPYEIITRIGAHVPRVLKF